MKDRSTVRIFISYRRSGGFDFAQTIESRLAFYKKKYGYDMEVFWDKEGLKEFTGHYSEMLDAELERCNVFLLLMSKGCFSIAPNGGTDWYKKEIKHVNERIRNGDDRVTFLPVWINGFSGKEIPTDPDLQFLENVESIDVSGERGGDFETLFFPKLCEKLKRRFEAFDNLYHRLSSPTVLRSRADIEAAHSLQARLHPDVVSVDICALAANGLLNAHARFFESVQCPVRFVICDHTQPMLLDYANQVMHEGDEEDVEFWIANSLRSLKKLSSRNPHLQARIVGLPLTAAIFIIRCKDPNMSTVKVDYYDFDCDDADRRSLMISHYDTESFAFYEKQFEWIWNNARPIES